MEKFSQKYQRKKPSLTIELEDNLKEVFTSLPKNKPYRALASFKSVIEPKLPNFKSIDRTRQNSLFKKIVTTGKRINLERSSSKDSKNLKSIGSLERVTHSKHFESSAVVRPSVYKNVERVSRKSTDFLVSGELSRKNLVPPNSRLSDVSSKAVFQKIKMFPAQPSAKKEAPQPKTQVSSIIFDPGAASNTRQTMTVNFLKERFGPEKFEIVKSMYLEKQCALKDIEAILTDSQKCLVKLFPVAFEFSTPTTQESRVSGRCSFK